MITSELRTGSTYVNFNVTLSIIHLEDQILVNNSI